MRPAGNGGGTTNCILAVTDISQPGIDRSYFEANASEGLKAWWTARDSSQIYSRGCEGARPVGIRLDICTLAALVSDGSTWL